MSYCCCSDTLTVYFSLYLNLPFCSLFSTHLIKFLFLYVSFLAFFGRNYFFIFSIPFLVSHPFLFLSVVIIEIEYISLHQYKLMVSFI